MKKFVVTKAAMRPVTDAEECFYCKRLIGADHKEDCVLLNSKAIVTATITYEIDVPAFWTKADIEFHRNEATWCSDNMLNDLEQLSEKNGCLCGEIQYVCNWISDEVTLDE